MKSKFLTLGSTAVIAIAMLAAFELVQHRVDDRVSPDFQLTTASIVTRNAEVPDTRRASEGSPVVVAQSNQSGTQSTTDPAKPQVVDESALRYFAAKGDKARLDAEIARLRALYPDWVPPSDPLAVPENADQQLAAMWKLYSEAKYADLRKAIADRQAAEPAWKVPADLLDRLAVAEKRTTLIAASNDKKYADVVELGAETPSLLTCSDVDVLWRVAEAFAKTDRMPRAIDAYSYILQNCTKTPERVATIQKASAFLDYDQMQPLLDTEKKLSDGTGEFEPIRDDLARRFVAEGDENGELLVAPAYIERVDKALAKEGKASDALLLGWYYIKRKDMAVAERYFRKAHDVQDSASASQGLALALIAKKEPQEAEAVMYAWRDSSEEADATYFAAAANLLAIEPPPVLGQDVLRRMAAAAAAKKEIKTAEQFGWYALYYRQPQTAAQWFRTTLGWKADYEPAAYGLAVARLQLKDMAGVRQIQHLWEGRSERIARVTEPQPKKASVEDIPCPCGPSTVNGGDGIDRSTTRSILPEPEQPKELTTKSIPQVIRVASTATRSCSVSVDPERLSPQVALNRGWCLMELNRPLEAAAAFGVALRSNSEKAREDAAYGQSLAYLRAGLVNDAAVSATKARQDVKRAVELQVAILSDRAVNAFGAGRYRETLLYLDQLAQLQTERTDLLVLRAYAYKGLKRNADAIRIFEALAQTGNREAIRGLAETPAEASHKTDSSSR